MIIRSGSIPIYPDATSGKFFTPVFLDDTITAMGVYPPLAYGGNIELSVGQGLEKEG